MLCLLSSAVWRRHFGQLQGPGRQRGLLAEVKGLKRWQPKLSWLGEGSLVCHLCIHCVILFYTRLYSKALLAPLCVLICSVIRPQGVTKTNGNCGFSFKQGRAVASEPQPCPQLFSKLKTMCGLHSGLQARLLQKGDF